jgi:hypothetical protein
MSNYTEALIRIAKTELNTFKNGKLLESDKSVYERIGTYWESIPVEGIDGRTKMKNSKGKLYNPAWSSAFISFIVREAGAGQGFKYAEVHCHYIEAARKAAASNNGASSYFSVDPYSDMPAVGDIICAGREYAKEYDFKQAELSYKADSFYPSHGDVVVEIRLNERVLIAIGGNVSDSVREKQIPLSSSGKLIDREDGNKMLPWLALLKCAFNYL